MRSSSWPRTVRMASGRTARFFAGRRGLNQLVDNGGEPALCGLCRPIENDRCREVASVLGARFDIGPAGVVERAIDLHLHDLEPRRKQTLRLLVGLEHD